MRAFLLLPSLNIPAPQDRRNRPTARAQPDEPLSERQVPRWVRLLPLLSVLLLTACSDKTPVELGRAQRRTLLSRVSVSGEIQPEVEVPIAPDVSGEVVKIKVKEGQRVTKGDLLFVIRPDNYEAALEQAVASLNSAKADYANAKAAVGRAQTSLKQDSVEYFRSKQLYEDKAIPKQQFEQARLKYQLSQSNLASAKEQRQAAFFRVQNAEASVKQARDQLRQTRVYASMDGTVTALDVQLGERVVGTGMQMGTEVMRIADLSRMLVEVEVNENDIVDLQLGDTAKVEVDAYPERVFKGKVVEIGFAPKSAQGGGSGLGGAGGGSSTNDQVTNYPVKVLIQPSSYENDSALMGRIPEHQSPFRPSMSAVVNIYTDRAEDVVSVPIQAVTLDRQTGTGATDERIVFRYDSSAHKVRRQPVTTGISDDTYMAIQEGLAAGTPIVTGPYNTVTKELRDGMTVKERQADQEREKDEAEE